MRSSIGKAPYRWLDTAHLVGRVWGEATDERSVGRGRVLGSQPLAVAMQSLAIMPDCTFGGDDVDPELRYVHRKLEHGDIYFITNGTERAQVVEASFRVSGFSPEIWRADSGEISPVRNDQHCRVLSQ